jgi:phage RecT family recombinase
MSPSINEREHSAIDRKTGGKMMHSSFNANQIEVKKEAVVQLTPEQQKEQKKNKRTLEVKSKLSDVVKSYIPVKNGHPVINPENFIKSAMTFVKNLKDDAVDKDTIVSALLHCASDGLLPDGKQSTLIPYGGAFTYIPMYQGLIEIAYRGGAIQSLNTHIIHDNDTFDVQMGTEEKITHIPNIFENGNKIAVYAVATLNTGGKIYCLLKRKEVESIKKEMTDKLRKKNKSNNQAIRKQEEDDEAKRIANSPWTKYEDEMWKKTAIRRIYKMIPKSNTEIVQQRSPEEYEGYVPVMHDDVIDISHMNEAPETKKVTNVNATLEEITNH